MIAVNNSTGGMVRQSGVWACADCGEKTYIEASSNFPPCPRSESRVVWNYKGRL